MRKYQNAKKRRKMQQILSLLIMLALAFTPIFLTNVSVKVEASPSDNIPPPLILTVTDTGTGTGTDNSIPPPLLWEYPTEFVETYEIFDEINDDIPLDFTLIDETDVEDDDSAEGCAAIIELENDNTDSDLLNPEDNFLLFYGNTYLPQPEPPKPPALTVPPTLDLNVTPAIENETKDEGLPVISEESEESGEETTEIETTGESVAEPITETATESATPPIEPIIINMTPEKPHIQIIDIIEIIETTETTEPTAETIEITTETTIPEPLIPMANLSAPTVEEGTAADNIFYEIMPKDLIPLNNGWFAKNLGDGLYEIFDDACAPLGIVQLNGGESIEDWEDYDSLIPFADSAIDDTTSAASDLPIPSPQTGDNSIHIILGLWILTAAGLYIFKKR